jgi:hypothetical protein
MDLEKRKCAMFLKVIFGAISNNFDDFRLSPWLIVDVECVVGSLHHMDFGTVFLTFLRYMLPPSSG